MNFFFDSSVAAAHYRQVNQFTDRHALHIAEVLDLALRHGPGGPRGLTPEADLVREHYATLRRSRLEAAAVLGGIATSVAALAALLKNTNGRGKELQIR